jgi:hypothetical protein
MEEENNENARFPLLLLNVIELSEESAVPYFPHNDSKREDIRLLGHDVGVQHLRCKVLDSSVLDTGNLAIMRGHFHGQSEVAQLGNEAPWILHTSLQLREHIFPPATVATTVSKQLRSVTNKHKVILTRGAASMWRPLPSGTLVHVPTKCNSIRGTLVQHSSAERQQPHGAPCGLRPAARYGA